MQVQLINLTKEDLQQIILDGIKSEFDKIKTNFQPKEPTELLTRDEVKDLLKIDLSTLYLWTKKGRIPSFGIGHRVYYKRKDVENSLIPLNEKGGKDE